MCDKCYKETNEVFEMDNGDYYCQECYEAMADMAELMQDNYLEAAATGN